MSNKWKLALIAALMATSSGCKLFQNMVRTMILEPIQFTAHIDDKLEFARYRRLATSILDQCEPRRCQNRHFARGFKYGFADYLIAGPRAAPPLPPRRYWDSQYQTAAGHQSALDWFQGYEQGVAAACESGHRGHVTVALNPQLAGFDTYVSSRPDYAVGCGVSYDQVVDGYVTEPMVVDSVLTEDLPIEELPETEHAVEAESNQQKSTNPQPPPSDTAVPDASGPDTSVPNAKSKPVDPVPADVPSPGIKSPSDKTLELMEPPTEIRNFVLPPGTHAQTGYQPVDTGFGSSVAFASPLALTTTQTTQAKYTQPIGSSAQSVPVSPANPRQLTAKQ